MVILNDLGFHRQLRRIPRPSNSRGYFTSGSFSLQRFALLCRQDLREFFGVNLDDICDPIASIPPLFVAYGRPVFIGLRGRLDDSIQIRRRRVRCTTDKFLRRGVSYIEEVLLRDSLAPDNHGIVKHPYLPFSILPGKQNWNFDYALALWTRSANATSCAATNSRDFGSTSRISSNFCGASPIRTSGLTKTLA